MSVIDSAYEIINAAAVPVSKTHALHWANAQSVLTKISSNDTAAKLHRVLLRFNQELMPASEASIIIFLGQR